jgi:copper chaperone CopZ
LGVASRFILQISGMNAVHAVRALQTALAGVEGVLEADVRLGSAVVTHDGRATERAIRDAVETAGLTITSLSEDRRRHLPFLE